MTEPAPTPAPAPAPAPTPTPAPAPWHQGVDATILGHWQNKNFDLSDPGKVAVEATKAAIEAQKFIGVPAAELLRMPKPDAPEADRNAFWQRLGAPGDAKEYDFSAVKHADGSEPAAALIDTIRATAAALHVPKDRAADLANAMVKHLDGVKAEQVATSGAKLAAEKAALAQSWGNNFDFNKLTAMQGAKRLGVDPETVALLENHEGYSKVMEMFRKVGAGTSEDSFVEGRGGGGNPATMEGAQARLAELQTDPAWGKRLLAGDAATRREFDSLTRLIAGSAAA